MEIKDSEFVVNKLLKYCGDVCPLNECDDCVIDELIIYLWG